MSTLLLPASPQTVFTYEVKNGSFVWTSVPQPFKENLLNVDEIMPALLAEMLLLCYRNKGGCSTHELCEQTTATDPLHLDTRYRLKILRFLEALALGMNPQQPWDGNIDIPPHFSICTPTATAVTFRPYERPQLREYLYHHTYFESPSPARNNREQQKASTATRPLLHLPLQIRYSYAHG